MSTPWIQTFGGIEVCQTQFSHPDITSGQHTNGPMSIWVRVPGGEWVPADSWKMHEVRWWCDAFGAEYVKYLEGEQ